MRSLGLSLFVGWIAVSPVLAQPLARPAGWANLRLRFDSRGNARVTLNHSPVQDPTRLKEALQAVLGKLEYQTSSATFVEAQARGVLARYPWVADGTLDLAPLNRALNQQGIPRLNVYLEHPKVGFEEISWKTHPTQILGFAVLHGSSISTLGIPPPLRIRYGFPPSFRYHEGWLLVFLVVPLFVAWYRQRLSLRRRGDPLVVWYRHWLGERWLHGTIWVGWFVLLVTLDAGRAWTFRLFADFSGGLLITVLVYVVPPAVVMGVGKCLSAPVYARVPEVGWTRLQVLSQALWFTLLLTIPALCFAWFLDGTVANQGFARWPWVGAGMLATLFCKGGYLLSRNLKLLPLNTGPFLERVREMSEDVGIRVRTVQVLPPHHWRIANVLYRSQQWILITPPLLEHLTRREVNALLAHQFAHSGRMQTIAWISGPVLFLLAVIFLLGGFGLGTIGVFVLVRYWPLMVIIWALVFVWTIYNRERFTSRGDVSAVKLTGDTEALLTALEKLRGLGLLPLTSVESQPPPPGTPWPRLEELAHRTRVPSERLEDILASPGSGTDQYGSMTEELPGVDPSLTERETSAFSATFKNRLIYLLSWGMIGMQMGLPALAAYLTHRSGASGWTLAGLYVGGIILGFLAARVVVLLGGHWASWRVRRALHKSLREENWLSEGDEPIFVGLSPGAKPEVYEGFHTWDLGFVVFSCGRLCYLGGRMHFALRSDQITRLELIPGMPDWTQVWRIRVSWKSTPEAEEKHFLLNTAVLGLRSNRSRTQQLLARIQRWQGEADPSQVLPAHLADLVPPESWPGSVASGKRTLRLATFILTYLLLGIPAVTLGALLGLPMDPMQPGTVWYIWIALILAELLQGAPLYLSQRKEEDAQPTQPAQPTPGAIDPTADAR